MSKRLTKTIWYGSGVDSNGNPILPSNNGGLDGLNYGELYLHLSNGKATLWTLSSDGKIVEITGGADVDMSKYLLKSIWDKVFELKTDSQGTDYIFSKLPVVTQYGITMYSGEGVDIPSLASGLPFDGRTIWYNPDTNQIEVIGGTGGGSGEGVSNFWDLSGIPSWITISKPKYTYSEIEGTPDLSIFATQNWIISQGYASAEELKKYIPISGYTEVSGEKNFTGGLKVNGSPIYYDTEKKYWKLDGDLLVTGGVTMYGVDSAEIPSLIKSLPVASTKEKGVAYFDPDFFSVSSDGKVSFIGETGGGLDIVSLQNYLTQNSYLNVTEGDNRYLKLSGGTISREDGIPLTINRTGGNMTSISYRMDGVQVGVLGFDYSDLRVRPNASVNTSTYYRVWHEGNDGADSGLDADMLDGYHRSSFYSLYGGLHIDATSSYNVDLNTLTSANSYYQATSANANYVTNKPSGVGSAFRLYVSNSNGTNSKYLRQRIQQFNSADIYERVSNNSGSTWTDWVLVQTGLSSFTASSTLNGTLSITLGSLSANVDNLYAKTTRFFANQWNYDDGTEFDLNEWDTGGIVRCYGGSNNLLNRPNGFSYGNVLSLSNGTKALTGQLAWAVNHNSTTDTTKALWFRASDSANGFTYSPWRKIAFADLFLPLTGGTLSGALSLKNNCKLVGFDTSGGEAYIAYVSQSNNVILGSISHNAYLSGTTVNIRYGGTSGIYLDSSGNVGVGTTTPAYKLDVNGTIHGDLKMKTPRTIWGQSFDGTSNIKGNIYVINEDANTINQGSGKIKFNSFNATNVDKDKQRSPYIQAIYQSTYGRKRLSVFQSNAANYEDDFVEVCTILPNGNVGIGTSSPSYKLHVTGDIFASSKVNVNGIEVSKSKDDVLYIDGNVVVRGGVTMYGTNSTTAPSILDSLPIASTTTKGVAYFDSEFFSVGSDGKVSFIGKTDGFNATELQNYLTQNSYLNTTQGDDRYLKLSGGTVKGNLTIANSDIFPLRVKNTYSDATNAYLAFYANSVRLASIGGSTDGYLYRYNKELTATYKIWDSGSDGADSGLDADLLDGKQPSDLNVGSATKLETARTIWGKSFDGTGNVSGDVTLDNKSYIKCCDTSGNSYNAFGLNASNLLLIGYGTRGAGYATSIYGKQLSLYSGTSGSAKFILDSSGNVGIGTPSPSSLLDVNGNASITGQLKLPTTERSAFDNPQILLGNSLARIGVASTGFMGIYSKTSIRLSQDSETAASTTGLWVYTGGFVGINNSAPTHTLDVSGTLNATGAATLGSTLGVAGTSSFADSITLTNTSSAASCAISFDRSHSYLKFVSSINIGTNYSGTATVVRINSDKRVGINTISPERTLHVVGDTYLNGDVFVDELNTFDILPRTNNAYSCGNSSLRWYQVYGNIGDFSGAVNMGSTLDVTGMTTMTNATITGYLRLKDTTNYGRAIYFGDGELCYLEEASDDVLTIYANAGIKLNTSSASYNVSINTNLLVSGGITMYSQRSLKNIQDERGLSLDELRAIKPIRYTWKDNRDNRLHIGGIADDIQQILPEVVYKTNDGVLTMDYGNAAFAIASSLIKPVVDHEKRIAMLEEENKELRNEIERLKSA